MRTRRTRDDGVTVVEAAFAVPILFMFVMALIDLGMWTLNDNQATNAARDGAREGILAYAYADVPGSADHDAIVDRIESHLPGREIEIQNIDVRCVDPAGVELPGNCVSARPDVDRIEVEVEWTWALITPIAGIVGVDEGTAAGTATMSIIGLPVPGTPTVEPPPDDENPDPEVEPPPDVTECVISDLQVQPDPVRSKSNGQLINDITITYTTNEVDRCNALAVQMTTPAPGSTLVSAICVQCELAQNHEWTYSSNKPEWDRGPATVRIFNEFIDVSGAFNVTG